MLRLVCKNNSIEGYPFIIRFKTLHIVRKNREILGIVLRVIHL